MIEKQIYAGELTPEQKELLEAGEKIREMGHDPVRILKFFLEANDTVEKAVEMGKQAGDFLRKQWEEYEKTKK
ncbi:MAG: hypothetical protein GY749_14655 [Desulfobacteraceae bacterium]|nr:hypothetical protein [Desulfobacteraceae bacterium]